MQITRYGGYMDKIQEKVLEYCKKAKKILEDQVGLDYLTSENIIEVAKMIQLEELNKLR